MDSDLPVNPPDPPRPPSADPDVAPPDSVTQKRRLQPRPAIIPPIAVPTPPTRPATPDPSSGRPQERRDFFSDAMCEVLSPFAGMIERKLQPLLTAIEAIPDQAERLSKLNVGSMALYQLHGRINSALPGPPILRSSAALPPRIERYLRPPGAMKPGEFESVCSRCGKCVEACPAEAIKL